MAELTYLGPDGREGKLTFDDDDRLADALRYFNARFSADQGAWWSTASGSQGSTTLDRLIYFPRSTLMQAQFEYGVPNDLLEEWT